MATPAPTQSDEVTAPSPKLLAFYLPQFHPIPENDEWWGPGFTEWSNVVRARPRFPGHYQPHLPAELGFYDLRLPEVRAAQARLAQEHGIYGFCYYHYWFHGRRLLQLPFDEVLRLGEPEFPFALCWANEPWTRNWDARTGTTLVEQCYGDADDLEHIRWLLTAFDDKRYIKIDGRPLMLVYRVGQLPDPARTAERWRNEAQRHGFDDLYLCAVESEGIDRDPATFGFDAAVGFVPIRGARTITSIPGHLDHVVTDYEDVVNDVLSTPDRPYKRFPGVTVGWDNTARRHADAKIFVNTTPERYARWLSATVAGTAGTRDEENFIFVVAWNEWAEGNHLEPDQRYGRAFLEATRDSLQQFGPSATSSSEEPAGEADPAYIYDQPFSKDSAGGHIVQLIEELVPRGRRVLDLGAGAGVLGEVLVERGYRYKGFDHHPDGLEAMARRGLDHQPCDLSDPAQLADALGSAEDVGAVILADVLEHLVEPQAALAALAEWAAAAPSVVCLISVPNVAHFDLGLQLLLGRWDLRPWGLLDSTHVRFFTHATLERLVTRCGWELAERNDVFNLRSEHYPGWAIDELPLPVFGALDLLARTENEHSTVYQFVWALRLGSEPVAPPVSLLDAVGATEEGSDDLALSPATASKLAHFIADLSLLEGEARRRVGSPQSPGRASTPPAPAPAPALPLRILRLVDTHDLGGRTTGAAVEALAEVYMERPDLHKAFGVGEKLDLVGLLEWAEHAEDYGDSDASKLGPFGDVFADIARAEAALPTVERILVLLGLGRRDISPRQREALSILATVFDRREDLQGAFELNGADGAAGLLEWGTKAADWDDFEAAYVDPFAKYYREILATAGRVEDA